MVYTDMPTGDMERSCTYTPTEAKTSVQKIPVQSGDELLEHLRDRSATPNRIKTSGSKLIYFFIKPALG